MEKFKVFDCEYNNNIYKNTKIANTHASVERTAQLTFLKDITIILHVGYKGLFTNPHWARLVMDSRRTPGIREEASVLTAVMLPIAIPVHIIMNTDTIPSTHNLSDYFNTFSIL